MPAGIASSAAAGTVIYSASPPDRAMPMTGRPGENPAMSAAVASTTPANSYPGVKGSGSLV